MDTQSAHLEALRSRHQALEKEIAAEMKHAARDSIHLSELKKEKLRIKEELVGITEHT